MYYELDIRHDLFDFGILIIAGRLYMFDVFEYIEFSLN